MATKAQPSENISRIALWPIWLVGRWAAGLLLLSAFGLMAAVALYRWNISLPLDGESVPVSPEYMRVIAQRALSDAPSPAMASQISEWAYTAYFRWTGLHAMAASGSKLARAWPNELAVAMLASTIFGARLANVLVAMPLVGLVLLLATIDGWTERAIRRACAGVESSTWFALARKYAYTLFPPFVGLFYLCLPLDIQAGDVLLPALIVSAILVRTKLKWYKKYV